MIGRVAVLQRDAAEPRLPMVLIRVTESNSFTIIGSSRPNGNNNSIVVVVA